MPSLAALRASAAEITCVLTQPDRPAGRGRRPAASAVKSAAGELPVVQPERLSDPRQIEAFGPVPELLIVVAYGLILPEWLLAWPRRGAVNVHASLLPRWRGAAPIQRAILAGDRRTGVSIMQMRRGLDTGPVYTSATVAIGPTTTAPQLHDVLADLGARTLMQALPGILAGTSIPQPQDEAAATYAAKISKAEARIDWRDSAIDIDRRVRAFAGWPVAESTLSDGRRLRIQACVPQAGECSAAPGTVIAASGDGITVAAGRGTVRITRLQPPGGRIMDAGAWLAAHSVTDVRFQSPEV